MSKHISPAYLHTVLDADFATGTLYYKGKSKPLGAIVRVGEGQSYWRISLKGPDGVFRNLYSHRVLIAMKTGEWPRATDHLDGDGLNNTETNLRDVTTTVNMRNRRFRNPSPYGTGVRLQQDRYWISTVSGVPEVYRKDLYSLFDVQKRTLVRYATTQGFTERHYKPLLDAISINPDWIAQKEKLAQGDLS